MANKGKFAVWNQKIGIMQPNVKNFFDPTAALPVDPAVGDRYVASASGNGWTFNNIYEYNGATWDELAAGMNMQLRTDVTSADWWFDGTNWVLISVANKAGRNEYLENTPSPRAAEWNGTGANQHTIRRGRSSWAKPRV